MPSRPRSTPSRARKSSLWSDRRSWTNRLQSSGGRRRCWTPASVTCRTGWVCWLLLPCCSSHYCCCCYCFCVETRETGLAGRAASYAESLSSPCHSRRPDWTDHSPVRPPACLPELPLLVHTQVTAADAALREREVALAEMQAVASQHSAREASLVSREAAAEAAEAALEARTAQLQVQGACYVSAAVACKHRVPVTL